MGDRDFETAETRPRYRFGHESHEERRDEGGLLSAALIGLVRFVLLVNRLWFSVSGPEVELLVDREFANRPGDFHRQVPPWQKSARVDALRRVRAEPFEVVFQFECCEPAAGNLELKFGATAYVVGVRRDGTRLDGLEATSEVVASPWAVPVAPDVVH